MRLKLVPNETTINFFGKSNVFFGVSIFAVILSFITYIILGLNFGIDFKGGTSIRSESKVEIEIAKYRNALSSLNLGDVAIKKFGKKDDFLIKFEKKENNKNLIQNIKIKLTKTLGAGYEIRRVENVGPKVSSELLKSGLIAIAAALGAMLFYIWIRFEWQFSIGAIIALFHDVILTMGFFSLFALLHF